MSFTPNHRGKVAVIDSGVGGLSVVAKLRLMLPNSAIEYFADTANCPYGAKSKEQITQLTIALVEKVVEAGAEIIVVACNTMTSAAISTLRERWQGVDFVGMEPAIKPAVLSTRSKVVGVLATRATLSGELYRLTKESYGEGVKIVEIAGEGLVEFIESEDYFSEGCRALTKTYIDSMVAEGADEIVLGCTHCPFLSEVIGDIVSGLALGRDIEIVNPAMAVAQRACDLAIGRGIVESEGCGVITYHTSGTSEQLAVLKNFLDSYQNKKEQWCKKREEQ